MGERPTDCIICCETLSINEPALSCGHYLHLTCVKKHFKPECPLCRRPLDISVQGTRPTAFIPFDATENRFVARRDDGMIYVRANYSDETRIL